jgi:predicted DNA-binding transcriptional regulator AlpA
MMAPAMRLLTYPELKTLKGVRYSRSHLRRLISDGLFPAPIEIGPGRKYWVDEEIDEHVRKLVRLRNAGRAA